MEWLFVFVLLAGFFLIFLVAIEVKSPPHRDDDWKCISDRRHESKPYDGPDRRSSDV